MSDRVPRKPEENHYTGNRQTFDCDQNRPERLHAENAALRERLKLFEAFAAAHKKVHDDIICDHWTTFIDPLPEPLYSDFLALKDFREAAMKGDKPCPS